MSDAVSLTMGNSGLPVGNRLPGHKNFLRKRLLRKPLRVAVFFYLSADFHVHSLLTCHSYTTKERRALSKVFDMGGPYRNFPKAEGLRAVLPDDLQGHIVVYTHGARGAARAVLQDKDILPRCGAAAAVFGQKRAAVALPEGEKPVQLRD